MRLIRTLLLICLPLPGIAQTADAEMKVRARIEALFSAMRQGDSATLRTLMHPDLRMMTVGEEPDGTPFLRTGNLQGWLDAVGGAGPGTLDERVWSYAIEVDGDLASVWTPYTFFLNGQVHHCGVNAFQLFRTTAGWQIIQVTDTRRSEGCISSSEELESSLHQLIDDWHAAAARADAEAFFGAMAEDGIYVGTDPDERWRRDELRSWARDAFERDTAWAFTPLKRNLRIAPDGFTAWWDEKLETWMGICRATGILRREGPDWKIVHYQLSVALPNEDMPAYLELIQKE